MPESTKAIVGSRGAVGSVGQSWSTPTAVGHACEELKRAAGSNDLVASPLEGRRNRRMAYLRQWPD